MQGKAKVESRGPGCGDRVAFRRGKLDPWVADDAPFENCGARRDAAAKERAPTAPMRAMVAPLFLDDFSLSVSYTGDTRRTVSFPKP